jgi:hypothetical protein
MKRPPEFDVRNDAVIQAYARGVDVSLLDENLRLTPDERLAKAARAIALAVELRRAGEEHRRQGKK